MNSTFPSMSGKPPHLQVECLISEYVVPYADLRSGTPQQRKDLGKRFFFFPWESWLAKSVAKTFTILTSLGFLLSMEFQGDLYIFLYIYRYACFGRIKKWKRKQFFWVICPGEMFWLGSIIMALERLEAGLLSDLPSELTDGVFQVSRHRRRDGDEKKTGWNREKTWPPQESQTFSQDV